MPGVPSPNAGAAGDARERAATRREVRQLAWHAVKAKVRLCLRRPGALWFYLNFYARTAGRRDVAVSIVSYPKSGRTWLERMLIETCRVHHRIEADYATILDLARANEAVPSVRFTHAGSSWEGDRPRDAAAYAALAPSNLAAGRVIFLHRDPRDVLVSSYHHLVKRTGIRSIDAQRMIDSHVIGARKIVAVMNLWMRYAAAHPDSTLRISYEQLQADPAGTLGAVLDFIGINAADTAIAEAIDRCRFDRMKQAERGGEYQSPRLAATDPNDPDSFKVRSGKVGEYRSFFSPEQVAALDAIIDEHLDPRFHYQSPRR